MNKSPVVLQSLPCNDYAVAMALISDDENDFLCCATYSSDEIQVCDASTLDKKKASTSKTSASTLASSGSSSSAPASYCKTDTLKVAGLKNAFSMTVVENHLFVTEWKSDMVHKIEVVVDIGVDNEVASTSYDRWSLGTGEGLNCLTNTKDNRFLLITCPEVASLTIVDVNGKLKRKIPLDFSIDKPSEALQLNDDEGIDTMFVVQVGDDLLVITSKYKSTKLILFYFLNILLISNCSMVSNFVENKMFSYLLHGVGIISLDLIHK